MTSQRSDDPEVKPFKGPAGGWGSVRSLAESCRVNIWGRKVIS